MDGGTILLIFLGVMFTAITAYAVIARGRERAREWERSGRATSGVPMGTAVRDAADKFSEGQRLFRIGDYQAAVRAFTVAITLDPDHWTAYFRRAEAYRKLGLEEQANADLERAEFLMAAARQETSEGRGFPDDAEADLSVGPSVGAFVGGIVGVGALLGGIIGGAILGGNIGGYLGFCFYLIVICGPILGFVGGIVWGVIGEAIHRRLLRDRVDPSSMDSAGWGGFGCLGCSGAVVGLVIVIIITAILS